MSEFGDDRAREPHDHDEVTHYRELVERELDTWLPRADDPPRRLHEAMRYSVFAGGKRLRPILTMLSAQAVGANPLKLLGPASAVELLHTYTLVHDDLPCMDDDDLRRGKPSCHKAYGEALALLAGDALLTASFGMLADTARRAGLADGALVRVTSELAAAAGSLGVIAGQVADLDAVGKDLGVDDLQYIHKHKTGDLFVYACRAGALLSGAPEEHVEALSRFGELFGLLFQITDDILNVVGDPHKLGKPVGTDEQKSKPTYANLLGVKEAWRIAEETGGQATDYLSALPGNTTAMQTLTAKMLSRES